MKQYNDPIPGEDPNEPLSPRERCLNDVRALVYQAEEASEREEYRKCFTCFHDAEALYGYAMTLRKFGQVK
jgi:hypothetical protein